MQQDEKARLIPSNAFEAFQLGTVEVFNAWKLRITVAEALEPGRFTTHNQPWLEAGHLLMVKASDGWCWARVAEVDVSKRLILEREAPLLASPEPTVKLSRKAA